MILQDLLSEGISEDRIIDGGALYDLFEGSQYFTLEELPCECSDEVFVDVGCYDGMSTVAFSRWCGGGKSYGFEPDEQNAKRIFGVLKSKGVANFELIRKGAWDENGFLGFVSGENSMSHVSEGKQDGTDSIEVVKLDDALKGKRVTYIKMDIEGAEYKALVGARELITTQKPKLAICVYHKPQDIWELPDLILKMNPDYKFYLRHYSFQYDETVLYAF